MAVETLQRGHLARERHFAASPRNFHSPELSPSSLHSLHSQYFPDNVFAFIADNSGVPVPCMGGRHGRS